jgi:ATP-dependent protease ClpP protease subunit
MNGQPVISVRGEAWLEVEPEIAEVEVTIQARDRDRQTVLDLIKRYGEAVEKLETLRADTDRDRIFTAEAALGYGLVDQILTDRS